MKIENHGAWFLVLPVVGLVAVSALIPLMTAVNYSVQSFDDSRFFWAGTRWFHQVLTSERFWSALSRNLIFSGIILAIEIPLGLFIALNLPRRGWGAPVCLALLALPLMIPENVVGLIWQVFGRSDIGLLGWAINGLGAPYDYLQKPLDAWATLIVMDVWHWTSLVALLGYAGLVSIPPAYYQAARIDGASSLAIFRHIQLPKMGRVLTIAILLRFIDSFMIYTEAFIVTGGGPGGATTFLSTELMRMQMPIGQSNLGPTAAWSLIYFLIILLFSWLFYTVITRNERKTASGPKKTGAAS